MPIISAIVFPAFVETCREHIQGQEQLEEQEYEEFEALCLRQDGLALVEYAMDMMANGCVLDLSGRGRHRMLQDTV